MKASAIEFRFRMVIQIVIVILGFWAPWISFLEPSTGAFELGRRIATLEWLALEISRLGLASFTVAMPIVIVLGALAAAIGAVLRVWGAAYLGYDVVHHGQMQGGGVMAAGPYRYVRNPLYLGGWFMMIAISLLMPPSGALFTLVLLTIHFLRLILGEEAFLAAQLGEPYAAYKQAVPRLAPRLRAGLPASAAQPHWLAAVFAEVTAIGIFVALAFFSWSYNNELMMKAILISFGISLVVRGFARNKMNGGAGAAPQQSKTAK
jgi:protein-S-isoprenylcysteine O-methyltransferase Ste14